MKNSNAKIITFYSYKGGTGRSMALANVAWILASNGHRVLMVDWDLEAPGLHRYFHPFLIDKELHDSPGVIDLIWELAAKAMVRTEITDGPEWFKKELNRPDYVSSLRWNFLADSRKEGALDLMPAGQQRATYATRVNSFDWKNFYERIGGGVFLDALTEHWRAEYDYILVDSRTGVGDTSGICTVELPDILAICYMLNTQSIEGAAGAASSIADQRSDSGFRIFPIAMRVEDGEKKKLELSRAYARARFEPLLWHIPSEDHDRYWGEVEVPYSRFYAYEEILATFGDRPYEGKSVLASMERIASYLSDQRVTRLNPSSLEDRERILAEFEQAHQETGMKKLSRKSQLKQLELPAGRDVISMRPGADDRIIDVYRRWARERHRGLPMIGVGGGELRLRLDEVYVPLRISQRPLHPDLDERTSKRRGEMALECGAGDLELEQVFSRPQAGGPHVAIFGDPGAGKTTALAKLHYHCLSAGPESLGLAVGTVPVLLRLRRLGAADLESPLAKVIGRELAETSDGELPSDLDLRLWEHGRLLLLLDGLDEIADATLRAKVCKYLEWQLTGGELQHVRAVVSCRYSGYGGGVKLDERFLHLDVRPLDAEQCRRLVRLWFREIQRTLPHYPETDAREAAEGLIAALDGSDYASQRLKVLVGSPLLLTLLCVVVLRGGEMPRHRAAFYEQCLRVLLGQWGRARSGRSEKDWQPAVDVDTALAILRPLAYALHTQQRRDDLSAPELVLHVEERLGELGKSASAFEVIEWLHREAGVLDEYAPLHYGFVHLGLQEYLAALHIAAHGPELLDELCAHCGDEWWREVVLLLVGLPGRRLFAPLMERLLRSAALLEEADLIRACFEEAVELDPQPFLAVLDEPESPQRQAAVLRLLHGRTDPQLLARAAVLAQSDDRDVGALARQMLSTAQQRTAPGEEYDVFLVHHPAEHASAAELGRHLVRQGFRVVETASSMAILQQILDNTRGAALLVGASGHLPWEEPAIGHWLRLFAKRRRALVPVLLPGSGEIPPLPRDVPVGPWIDFSQGVASAGIEKLRQALAGPRVAIGLPRGHPDPGEPFMEPVTDERLLWIPGGRFPMGGERHDPERPIHWVRISRFWLAETPVTNRQYAVFLKQTGHEEPEFWRNRRFSASEQPVVGVSWLDAVAYCRWLSETSEMKFVLPTEAQWEFAARGTDGREYPWGNEEPDSSRACFGLDGEKGQPAPVGSFPAGRGPFGVLDQAGNVWEWCLDAWDVAAYRKRLVEEVVDPCGGGKEDATRAIRGGGWYFKVAVLRAAYRGNSPAAYRDRGFGFRIAVAPASL